MHKITSTDLCWRTWTTRKGPVSTCNAGQVSHGLLCYDKCPSGYKDNSLPAPHCVEQCRSGWSKVWGVPLCRYTGRSYYAKLDCAWNGCDSGYHCLAAACRKDDAEYFPRRVETWDRNVQTVTCSDPKYPDEEVLGCYAPVPAGYSCVENACQQTSCAEGTVECGPARRDTPWSGLDTRPSSHLRTPPLWPCRGQP